MVILFWMGGREQVHFYRALIFGEEKLASECLLHALRSATA